MVVGIEGEREVSLEVEVALVAQRIEHQLAELGVGGSNPLERAKFWGIEGRRDRPKRFSVSCYSFERPSFPKMSSS